MDSEQIGIIKDEKGHTEIVYDIENCPEVNLSEKNTPPPTPKPPKDDTSGIMLEPDHPLLAKFQDALRQQLERQVSILSEEVTELEAGIKDKSTEREMLGVSVYDAQQMVQLQYESIEQYEKELKKLSIDREDIESELAGITETHALTKNKLELAEKKDSELRNELNTMSFMYKQMSDWEEKLQSDIAVQQRISDKSKADRKQFTEEKRTWDFLIYKLMTEVFRLENNLDLLNMQLRVKEEEKENLATSIASSNADIEALETEHKRLMHSWNCVLVAIAHRDKLYDNTKNELQKEQENLKSTIREIVAMKKLNNDQMARNEQLTLTKEKINMEKSAILSKLHYECDKISQLEKKLFDIESILKQTSKDYDNVQTDKKVKQQAIDDIRREIEKTTSIKIEIEERILNILQEQISNDKMSKYMNKTIRELRENNRNLECQLVTIENKNADVCLRIEEQKSQNEEVTKYLEEIKNTEKIHEEELAEKNNELKSVLSETKKFLYKYDDANKKFEILVQKAGGSELSPQEIKIKDLERGIQEFEEKIGKLKVFWLRQQSFILSLKEERYKQLNDLNIIRKQILLLEQQNLKLEDELEELDKQEKQFERNMSNYKFKIDKYSIQLYEKKGFKEHLDVNNEAFKSEYTQKLQEAELDCIRLEDKLEMLEDEKNELSKSLIDFNRETLIWETKVKLAEETKQTIKKAKSATGELSIMKAEIHRMSVRYTQLRKAQEKLVLDLNQCLSRREFIFVNANATEKRLSMGGKVTNRINMKRKLEDAKIKVKKLEREKIIMEKKINQSFDLKKKLCNDVDENEKIIESLNAQILDIMNNIEAAKIDRQRELESLLFKQHKLSSFTSISKGQYRPLYRTDSLLENEYSHQQEVNVKLQSVVENLLTDFPHHQTYLNKILCTLKVVYEN